MNWRQRLTVLAVVCVVGWAQYVLHRSGLRPGTLDFSDTNYPEAK